MQGKTHTGLLEAFLCQVCGPALFVREPVGRPERHSQIKGVTGDKVFSLPFYHTLIILYFFLQDFSFIMPHCESFEFKIINAPVVDIQTIYFPQCLKNAGREEEMPGIVQSRILIQKSILR